MLSLESALDAVRVIGYALVFAAALGLALWAGRGGRR